MPLKFELGEAFQFDWSEEGLLIGGLWRKLQVAHLKLCASRTFVLVAYPSQGHEMLFDAHTRSFQALGGIPRRGIYDNMKTAVDKVKKGKGRVVNARFSALCSHYLFDGYVEQAGRVSSTCLLSVARNHYSVPCELAGKLLSKRLYPERIEVIQADTLVASHPRLFERGQTCYDWQHYIGLAERKPGVLRNGAPFGEMPQALRQQQRHGEIPDQGPGERQGECRAALRMAALGNPLRATPSTAFPAQISGFFTANSHFKGEIWDNLIHNRCNGMRLMCLLKIRPVRTTSS